MTHITCFVITLSMLIGAAVQVLDGNRPVVMAIATLAMAILTIATMDD